MTVVIDKKITGYSVTTTDKASSPPPVPAQQAIAVAEPDRRLVLGALPGLAQRSLRFPRRPNERDGFVAWTSDFIHAPTGKFVLCISHAINGHTHPFEIWALGAEQPPAAALICQLLSKVLQTDDRAFIWHHIKAMKKATEVPFALTLPHTGETVTANSIGAAIALVYEAHARYIGYVLDDQDAMSSPMLGAMSSIREPKAQGTGGYASFEDVVNPNGDDFPMFIKECWVEGMQQPIPISVWAGSKKVPAESETILKLISLAMRHRDPAWIGMCLATLRKHVDTGRELGFARVGNNKPTYYASTWAYVADLLRNRYVQLGILNDHGEPVSQGTLFEFIEPATNKASLRPVSTNDMACPECKTIGKMALESGCWQCLECSWSKCS